MKSTIILSILLFGRIESLSCKGVCPGLEHLYDYYDEDPLVTKEDVEKCETFEEAKRANRTIVHNAYVPYYNGTQYECWPILEKGPCSENERIILDEEFLEDGLLKGCATYIIAFEFKLLKHELF